MDKKQIKAAFKRDAALMKSRMKGKYKMDCEKVIKERLNEAENVLKSGHNEKAKFDAALISVVLGLCEKEKAKSTAAISATVESGIEFFDLAVDEMKCAENYYGMYQTKGDKRLLQIAKQKLNHAAALGEILRESGKEKDAASLDGKRQRLERIIR